MDFTFDDTQQMLSDSVDRFIAGDYDFETRQRIAASESGYSPEIWQRFAEFGWLALPFAESDGGFDGGPVETMILMQAFGRGLVVEPYLANVILAGGVLRRLANDTQRETWLVPLIGGELQTALAFVEPQARYQLADVATEARRDGSGWRLSGAKGVVLNGGNAELLIVPARTDGGRRDADGITLFAVAAGADGVSMRRYPTVDGAQAAEIAMSDVRVGPDAVLGNIGQGLAVLEAAVEDATLAVCAEAVGIMQVLTDKTVAYSKSRRQFGVPIGSFQALQHRMVDMLTACEQSYSLLLWATSSHAGGGDSRRAVSAMKYQVGTAGRKVGQEAVQIHGAMGVTWDLDVGHYFKRLTTIGQIFGNADWHLDRVAA
jgi:alkylation response protein AidB-like acyl-CoA dehydrogenase